MAERAWPCAGRSDTAAWFQLWPEGPRGAAPPPHTGAALMDMVAVDADARRSIYCQPLYSTRSFAPVLAATPPAAARAGENPAQDPNPGPDAPAAPDAATAPSGGHVAGGDEAEARPPMVYVGSDAGVSAVGGPGAASGAAGPNPVARSGSWPDEREAGGAQQADAATPQRPRPASAPAAVRRSSLLPCHLLACRAQALKWKSPLGLVHAHNMPASLRLASCVQRTCIPLSRQPEIKANSMLHKLKMPALGVPASAR